MNIEYDNRVKNIKRLIYYRRKITSQLINAVCGGKTTQCLVRDMISDGIVRRDSNNTLDQCDDDNHLFAVVSRGLYKYNMDYNLPYPTVAGLGFILSNEIGISFSGLCILAKVYHDVWSIYNLSKVSHHHHHNTNNTKLPKETIYNFFEDWPMMNTSYVGKILHILCKKGLLLGTTKYVIYCDLNRLQHMHNSLIMQSVWVEQRCNMIRDILLQSYQPTLTIEQEHQLSLPEIREKIIDTAR